MREKAYKRRLKRKSRKMSNNKLRLALLEVREQMETIDTSNSNFQTLFLQEEIYSHELSNRGLLQWALKTSDD